MLDGGGVTIGNNGVVAPRVGIYTSNHAIDALERAAGGCYAKPVTVGHNVWIGGDVTINQAGTIGDNTIVGSGSVVTRPLPPHVIAVGSPARVLRAITQAGKT